MLTSKSTEELKNETIHGNYTIDLQAQAQRQSGAVGGVVPVTGKRSSLGTLGTVPN
jgi:hypothetical protein